MKGSPDKMQNKAFGSLYVVATPIGNLSDITERAIVILKAVSRILVEDTRHAQHLLTHYQIHKPLVSLHQYNEHERVLAVLSYLEQGEDIALISDAGTPLISDPGYPLVKAIKERQGKVIPIPGACALIAALSAAGLPTTHFAFEGFLPAKTSARKTYLESLLHDTRTLVFYESPHRIIATLTDVLAVFGEARQVVLARELTKRYEEFVHGNANDILTHFKQHPDAERGEMVLLVEGASIKETQEDSLKASNVLAILLEELPTKQAVNLTSKITGERKNRLYEMALSHRSE